VQFFYKCFSIAYVTLHNISLAAKVSVIIQNAEESLSPFDALQLTSHHITDSHTKPHVDRIRHNKIQCIKSLQSYTQAAKTNAITEACKAAL